MSIDLVCGKREEGKSTRALSLALAWSPRLVILDHRCQFNLGEIVSSPDELFDALDNAGGIVSYQLQTDIASDDKEEAMQIIEVVRQVWARGRDRNPAHRFSFMIDEAGELSRHGTMGRALHRMIRQIRLDTVKVLLLCHRPMDIAPPFRSLITDLYLFNITDQDDLDWLRQAGVSEEVRKTVAGLPLHHHIHVQLGTRNERAELYDDPEAWRVKWESGQASYNGPAHAY